MNDSECIYREDPIVFSCDKRKVVGRVNEASGSFLAVIMDFGSKESLQKGFIMRKSFTSLDTAKAELRATMDKYLEGIKSHG